MQNATISILNRTTAESAGGVQIAAPGGDGSRRGFADVMLEGTDKKDSLSSVSDQNVKKKALDGGQIPGRLRSDINPAMDPQGWIAVNIADRPIAKNAADSIEGVRQASLTVNDGVLIQGESSGLQIPAAKRGDAAISGTALVQPDTTAEAISAIPIHESVPKSQSFAQIEGSQIGGSQVGLAVASPAMSETGSALAANAPPAKESVALPQLAKQISPKTGQPFQAGPTGDLVAEGMAKTKSDRRSEAELRPLPLAETQPKTVPVPSQNTESQKAERILVAPTGGAAQENSLRAAFGEGKPADKLATPLPAVGTAVTPQQTAQQVLSASLAPSFFRPSEGSTNGLAQANNGEAPRPKQDLQQTIANATIQPGQLQATSKPAGWSQRPDASIPTSSPEAKPSEALGSVVGANTTPLREAGRLGPVEIASPTNPAGSNVGMLDIAPQPFSQMGELQPSSANASLSTQAGSGAPDQPLARHVAQQLANAAHNPPSGPVGLTLSPEELGRVHLMFKNDNGSLTVSLATERPETLDLMRRHIETLTQELRNIGYREVNISFGQERAGQGSFQSGAQQQAGDNMVSERPENEPPAIKIERPTSPILSVGPGGGIDLRL